MGWKFVREERKKRRKARFCDVIIYISIVAIVAYTVAAFIMQFMGFTEISATLTGCWYGFWTAEIVSLAAIKNSKTKYEKQHTKDEESEE